jgi:hypothetical protein
MLTIDPIAIEKRLESPDALVIAAGASTIDAEDVDEPPPRGRLQQEESPAPLHRQKGLDGRSARSAMGSSGRPGEVFTLKTSSTRSRA